uniref:Uncharacterized protein n=1 Tax=Anguilla anguilla TaxID=7936 RepID=A0A0E9X5M3_ANGAN
MHFSRSSRNSCAFIFSFFSVFYTVNHLHWEPWHMLIFGWDIELIHNTDNIEILFKECI